ncbi:hypothetical protein YC2023_005858 [Brassica napus]
MAEISPVMSPDKLPSAYSLLLGKRRHVYNQLRVRQGKRRSEESDGCSLDAGDNMKDAMDGAWKAAKETAIAGDDDHNDNDRIQEDKVAVELKDVSQPVDTTKYRGVEELRQQTGGEDKSP